MKTIADGISTEKKKKNSQPRRSRPPHSLNKNRSCRSPASAEEEAPNKSAGSGRGPGWWWRWCRWRRGEERERVSAAASSLFVGRRKRRNSGESGGDDDGENDSNTSSSSSSSSSIQPNTHPFGEQPVLAAAAEVRSLIFLSFSVSSPLFCQLET